MILHDLRPDIESSSTSVNVNRSSTYETIKQQMIIMLKLKIYTKSTLIKRVDFQQPPVIACNIILFCVRSMQIQFSWNQLKIVLHKNYSERTKTRSLFNRNRLKTKYALFSQ